MRKFESSRGDRMAARPLASPLIPSTSGTASHFTRWPGMMPFTLHFWTGKNRSVADRCSEIWRVGYCELCSRTGPCCGPSRSSLRSGKTPTRPWLAPRRPLQRRIQTRRLVSVVQIIVDHTCLKTLVHYTSSKTLGGE